jgi:hypothetical protein
LLAVDQASRVIAFYGVVSFKFWKRDRHLVAGMPCKLVVAEDFRRTFLFQELELRLLRQYTEAGFDFLMAFLVKPRVLLAHKALGFREVGKAYVYARPYRVAKLLKHYLGHYSFLLEPFSGFANWLLRTKVVRSPRHVQVREMRGFGDGIGPLLKESRLNLSVGAERSVDTLNWRFVEPRSRGYRIFCAEEDGLLVGYMVVRRMVMSGFDVLAIVDFLWLPERKDVGRALVSKIHDVCRQTEVDLLSCLQSRPSPFNPLFRRCGFFQTRECLTLLVHEPQSIFFGPADFSQWHLTWFEHDYV